MTRYQADVPTAQASRYLQQLCKHWGHRFPVEFDPTHGVIHLNETVITLDAEPEQLRLTLESSRADAFPRTCDVVGEHLQRFAFRETLDMRWVEATRGSEAMQD